MARLRLPLLFEKLGFRERYNHLRINELRDNDVFIIGYPKSGNTWLRFLIGNYLTSDECDFTNLNSFIPGLLENPELCNHLDSPRFMHAHLLVKDFRQFCGNFTNKVPKIIFIVRDGRDVAVSYYYHLLKNYKIKPNINFKDYLRRFNRGDFYPFQSWGLYIDNWLNMLEKYKSNSIVIRYEDLQKNTLDTYIKILNFAGLNIIDTKVFSAIQASCFSRLQQLENSQQNSNSNLMATDHSIKFIRSGEINQWNHYFNSHTLRLFLKAHQSSLVRLGYIN